VPDVAHFRFSRGCEEHLPRSFCSELMKLWHSKSYSTGSSVSHLQACVELLPVGPGVCWKDLRCIALKALGVCLR
jgi:hypothetical protein